ncbi:hypothetical protein COCVIDRAFT_96381, partial [Bipolaris victoriae FI3]
LLRVVTPAGKWEKLLSSVRSPPPSRPPFVIVRHRPPTRRPREPAERPVFGLFFFLS